MAEKLRRNDWILVIPVLLMLVGLVSHRLDGFPLDTDELATIRFSRGEAEQPFNLIQIWTAVVEISPDQAFGLPILYSLWSQLVGWSEYALRLLSLFAGLLSLAWIYRAGKDSFASWAGWVALMLMASSVYFVTYLHVARPYSMVVLFALMSVWGYWRLTLHPVTGASGRIARVSLLVGSVGIYYMHYYAVLLLVSLALWHFLFVPKDHRWWHPMLLLALATVIASPQFVGYVAGIHFVQTKSWHIRPGMMRTAEALPWFLQVLTNGIFQFSGGGGGRQIIRHRERRDPHLIFDRFDVLLRAIEKKSTVSPVTFSTLFQHGCIHHGAHHQ